VETLRRGFASFDLPDDVFEPGERKPTKATKKKPNMAKKAGPNDVKVEPVTRNGLNPKKRPIGSVEVSQPQFTES